MALLLTTSGTACMASIRFSRTGAAEYVLEAPLSGTDVLTSSKEQNSMRWDAHQIICTPAWGDFTVRVLPGSIPLRYTSAGLTREIRYKPVTASGGSVVAGSVVPGPSIALPPRTVSIK